MPPKKTSKAKTPQPMKGPMAIVKQQKAPQSAPPGKRKPTLAMDDESDVEEDTALFGNIKSSLFTQAKLANSFKKGAAAGSDDSDMDDSDELESPLHSTRSGLRRQAIVTKVATGKSKAAMLKKASTPAAVPEKKAKTPLANETKKAQTPNIKSVKLDKSQTPNIKTNTPKLKTPPAQPKSETPAAEKAKTPKSAKLMTLHVASKVVSVKSPAKGVEAMVSDIRASTPGEKKQKKDVLQGHKLTPPRKRQSSSQDDEKDSQDSGVVLTTNTIVSAADRVQAERDLRTLFVKELPNDVTEKELRELSQEVQSVRMQKFPKRFKKKRGSISYAYLEYTSEAIADKNYKKLTGKKLRDHELVVDYVGEKSKLISSDKFQDKKQRNLLKLYIGGYDTLTKADELRQLFRTAKSIEFPRQKKGFCFAIYCDVATARAAYESSRNLKVRNLPLMVDYARSLIMPGDKRAKQFEDSTDVVPPVKKARLEKSQQGKLKTAKKQDESDDDEEDESDDNEEEEMEDDSDDETNLWRQTMMSKMMDEKDDDDEDEEDEDEDEEDESEDDDEDDEDEDEEEDETDDDDGDGDDDDDENSDDDDVRDKVADKDDDEDDDDV